MHVARRGFQQPPFHQQVTFRKKVAPAVDWPDPEAQIPRLGERRYYSSAGLRLDRAMKTEARPDIPFSSNARGQGDPLRPILTVERLLELLPAALYTCDAPTGRITFCNSNAIALWGRTPRLHDTDERFCGSFKLWQTDGSPLAHDRTPMARAITEGRAARNEEVVIERPDGTRVAVVVNIDPILDADGRVVGAINVFHDTAVLKHAVEARARLAAIVDSSDDAIISKNLDGIIMSWNAGAERLFGYAPDEAIGQPVTMLIPAELRDQEPGILARVRRGERVDPYETIRRRKDGTLVEVSLSVSPRSRTCWPTRPSTPTPAARSS